MPLPLSLPRSLACLLAVPALVLAAPAPKPPEAASIEALALGLAPGGSAAESCFFAYCWNKYAGNRGGLARVLVAEPAATDAKAGASTKLRECIAVYTRDGRLLAHSASHGTVELGTLAAGDFERRDQVLIDAYRAAVAKLEPRKESEEDSLARLHAAKTLMHHGLGDTSFPVAVSFVEGSRKLEDGTTEASKVECLVWDHAGRHYLYQKGGSQTHVLDIPVNPAGGKTAACVKKGDTLEAVLFVAEYRKAHPEEKAVLLLPEVQGRLLGGFTGAAFTEKGKVYYYNLFLGRLQAETRKPADLENPAVLADELRTFIKNAFVNSERQRSGAKGVLIPNNGAILYERFRPTTPTSLPGDTDELQQRRVLQRLREAGVDAEAGASQGSPLKITFEGRELRHDAESGTRYRQKAVNHAGGAGGIEVTTTPGALPAGRDPSKNLPPPRLGGGKSGMATAYEPRKEDIERLERQAAEGVIPAAKELAEYLLAGKFVPKNVDRALELLDQAAKAGDADAALLCARQLGDHPRDDKDRAAAFEYYLQAARAGYRVAQYNAGAMLASGRGVKVDRAEGLAWMILANRNGMKGDGEAILRRDLAKKPELILKAEERANELQKECLPSNNGDEQPRIPGAGTVPQRALPQL